MSRRVAIVTGASRGIGRAIAIALAQSGFNVAVTSRDIHRLEDTIRQIEIAGGEGFAITMDVTNIQSVYDGVDQVQRRFDVIDVLVNNAGVNIPKPALEVTPEDWDTVVDTDLKGAFFCSQAVAVHMHRQQRGKIINVASAAGLIPAEDRAPYCSSKAGLIMLTRQLALEWASAGITVNAVAPTFVETELAAQTLNVPGMRERWTSRIPLGRIATTEDVASAVLYLTSPASDFLTGVALPIDGGLTMR